MRLAQLHRPLQAAASGCYRPALTYSLALRPAPTPTPLAKPIDGRRYASVKSQGAYKLRPRKTIPKKLGAKRSGDQYVIPGNIIYKQRGTVWHPGENAILGRDHTIHAAVAGYVKYYRDPARHPTRQYIGVAFERDDKLPYPRHAVRKRKLGMVAVPRREGVPPELMSRSGIPRRVVRTAEYYDLPAVTPEQSAEAPEAATESKTANTATSSSSSKKAKAPHHLTFIAQRWQERRRTRVLHLNRDYSYSEGNAAIGRLAGRTMYVAPWKLGSRKARFRRRARREKHEARMKADAERRRLAVLAEVRGTGKPKAAKGSGGSGNDKKSKGKGKKAAA